MNLDLNKRKIIHIDMDCFYVAVELLERPELKNFPVAVGGSPKARGVLATCNYPARKFGLHSAMASSYALKLCPRLIIIPPNMEKYQKVSAQIHEIFKKYTTIIEPLSLDEAYLDVSNSPHCQGSATWIARAIRREIYEKLHLTASTGAAPLKFLAKIASEQNKPNGEFVIPPEKVMSFIENLELKKIPGVGKVSAKKLADLGLLYGRDIQKIGLDFLKKEFGKLGERIFEFCSGIDNREVAVERIRKSVAIETTLAEDIFNLEQARDILKELYPRLLLRIKKVKPDLELSLIRKIGIKLKFSDFKITTLDNSNLLLNQENYQLLLTEIWNRRENRGIRLLGLHIYLN